MAFPLSSSGINDRIGIYKRIMTRLFQIMSRIIFSTHINSIDYYSTEPDPSLFCMQSICFINSVFVSCNSIEDILDKYEE